MDQSGASSFSLLEGFVDGKLIEQTPLTFLLTVAPQPYIRFGAYASIRVTVWPLALFRFRAFGTFPRANSQDKAVPLT